MRPTVPLLAGLLAVCGAARAQGIAVDLHCHFSMSQAARPIFRGEPGRGPLATRPDQVLVNQVEVEGLRASGLRLLVASVWPPFGLRPGVSARDEAQLQLEGLRALARRQPELTLVKDAASARAALARAGGLALLPGVEGGEGITRVEDVELYFAAGARVLTLFHFVDNALGGAAKGQVGRVVGVTPEGVSEKGLTPLGAEVVKRMFSLGMVVDLAHASDRSAQDVLALAEGAGVPVINSHTAARALTPMERNESDALVARIAQGGGLVGVTFFRGFSAGVPEGERLTPHEDGTCDDFLAHWRHLAKVAGNDALVLGTDFNGFVTRARPGGRCQSGVRTTADVGAVLAALKAEGVPAESLGGMGERFLKLLEKVEAKADPAARARAAALKVPRVEVLPRELP